MKKFLPFITLFLLGVSAFNIVMISQASAEKNQERAHKGKKYGMRSQAYFNKIDANNDGKLSMTEVKNFHQAKFKKKDKNNDGFITPDEFSKRLAKRQAKKK